MNKMILAVFISIASGFQLIVAAIVPNLNRSSTLNYNGFGRMVAGQRKGSTVQLSTGGSGGGGGYRMFTGLADVASAGVARLSKVASGSSGGSVGRIGYSTQ